MWTLRDSVVDVGGEESWEELLDRIDAARKTVPGRKRTGASVSLNACVDGLSVLAALHRTEEIGYRGLIGASEKISARVGEILGMSRGHSDRTMRDAWRVLEHAELLERWKHGRGQEVAYGDEEPLADGHEGTAEPPRARRLVLGLTLSVVAISYWAAPRRKPRRGGDVGAGPTSARFADNTTGQIRELSLPGNARPSRSSAGTTSELFYEESPVPGDAVAHGAAAPAVSRETARPVPHRRVPWRPEASAPNDLGTASTALLYDLETVLIRHRRPDRDRLLGIARAEISPERRLSQIAGTGPPARSGLPWDDWIWRWRGLPLADRRVACERALLPALLGRLRRIELCELAPDPNARPPSATPRELGARLVLERNTAPPESVVSRTRPPPAASAPRASPRAAPRWNAEPKPEWLVAAERRHVGEEKT